MKASLRIALVLSAFACASDASVVTNWYRLRPPSDMTNRVVIALDLHEVTNRTVSGKTVWTIGERLELPVFNVGPGETNFFTLCYDTTNRVGVAITRAYVFDRMTPFGCNQCRKSGIGSYSSFYIGNTPAYCEICPSRLTWPDNDRYNQTDNRLYEICIPKRAGGAGHYGYTRPYYKRLYFPDGYGLWQIAEVTGPTDNND